MSQTAQNYLDDAKEAKVIANEFKALYQRFAAYLTRNSTFAWDHTGGTPAYRQVDADGNVKGLDFTPGELSNAIGSLAEIKTLLEGGAPNTGNHWQNLEKLADD